MFAMRVRPRIESVCNNLSCHPFPVRMYHAGWQWWCGERLHTMVCPLCGARRYYVYEGGRIRRVHLTAGVVRFA